MVPEALFLRIKNKFLFLIVPVCFRRGRFIALKQQTPQFVVTVFLCVMFITLADSVSVLFEIFHSASPQFLHEDTFTDVAKIFMNCLAA